MTTLLEPDSCWISIEDLQKKKLCPYCHYPMAVKQINLTEACRTCFNTECQPHCMSILEVEYIQRSYKDMDCGQDFPNRPVCLEEAISKVNQLFSEVESMVSHKLSEELKNELKTLTYIRSEAEDSKGVSRVKVDHNESEDQNRCPGPSGDFLQIPDTSTLHLHQPTINSGISSEVDSAHMSQFEENAAHQYQTISTESSNITQNEQTFEHGATSTIPYSTNLHDNGYFLQNNSFDKPNNLLQHNTETKEDSMNCDNNSSNCFDFEPGENNSCEDITDWFNAIVDVKDNLPVPNDEIMTTEACIDVESKTNDVREEILPQSILLQEKEVKGFSDTHHEDSGGDVDKGNSKAEVKDFSDTHHEDSGGDVNKGNSKTEVKDLSDTHHEDSGGDVDKGNSETEENEVFDFSVKLSNTLRFYQPKKRRLRTANEETGIGVTANHNLLTKWSNISDDSELTSVSPPADQLVDKNDHCELFKDVDIASPSISFPTEPIVTAEPFERVVQPEPIFQPEIIRSCDSDVNHWPNKPLPSKIDINIKMSDQGEITLLFEEPSTVKRVGECSDDGKISGIVNKGRNKLSQKIAPSKITKSSVTSSVVKVQTNQMIPLNTPDVSKSNNKSNLGFNELKSFGGAKSSLQSVEKKAKGRKSKAIAKSKKKNVTGGKKQTLNDVNDDIERAIANVQHSSVSQPSEWNNIFSDIFT